MKVDAWMSEQPPLNGGRFVRGEIIEHHMDVKDRLDAPINVAKERHKVLGPMFRRTAREHFSGGDIEGSKQIERPVPDVVMRAPLGLPEIHRENRLRALERRRRGTASSPVPYSGYRRHAIRRRDQRAGLRIIPASFRFHIFANPVVTW